MILKTIIQKSIYICLQYNLNKEPYLIHQEQK